MNGLLPALCLLLVLLVPVAGRAGTLGEPYFETVPGTPDLANGIVTALAQDARGLLWFGTPEGLYSYDGYRLRAYRQRPGDPAALSDDYVRTLLARPDGSLWVATQGGGISIYHPAVDAFEQLRHRTGAASGLASDAPIALAQQSDGVVWIGHGAAGLDRHDPASGRFEHFRKADGTGLAHDTVRSLLVDRRGDLWLGGGDGLQRRRAGSDRFERIPAEPAADGFAGQYVYALYEATDGRIWIGTQAHGAAVLDPATLALQRFRPGGGATDLAHAWVDGFAEPQPGQVWLATFGAGIDVLDGASGAVLQRIRSDPAIPGSLALDRIVMPLKDRSGLLWLGSWGGGLQRYNPANARTFRTLRHSPARPGGLSHPAVHSALEIAPGQFWVGTGGNGIDWLDLERGVVGGHRPDPQRPGALRDGTIRALARTADGQRWVGTQQAGLHRWRAASDDFEAVPVGARIRCLLPTRAGTLVVGMQDGVAELDPASGQSRLLDFGPGQPFTDAAWSLAEDGTGNLWIGTPNGLLWRRAGAAVLQSGPVPGLEMRAVMDLELDPDGILWAAGPGTLARWRGWDADGRPRFEPVQAAGPEAPPLFGRQLLFDARGRLWTPRQLVDPASGRVEEFGAADGVAPDSVNVGATFASSAGLLLFGGARGLLLVDPAAHVPWRYAAPLLATAASIDGQPLPVDRLGGGLVLQPGQARLSVEFAALDYSAPEQVHYDYRLVGLDRDWIATEAGGRVAAYNNLWPGSYRLQVRARGRSGVWSPQLLELPVTVRPRWWQTALTPLLGLLLLGIAVYGGSAWRTRRLQRRERQLQALVDLRTGELSLAKERAERALDELKGAQQQLVAAEKMAALGQLVAGVAHEINTPIGIAITAASHLEDVARHGRDKLDSGSLSRKDLGHWQEQSAEAMRLVRSSLDRAAVLVASFKQVAVDHASAQRRSFVLDAFLREVQVALQPGLKRTPHRLELDCPPGLELDTYPGALFQILANLVNNAVAHAFPDERAGSVRIAARALPDQRIELCCSDDGAGMSADVAARAFDPFFTTRRGSGGSGLGLHVVHNLVTQLLGGTIELRSSNGQGTTVLMRIPARAPDGDGRTP